MNKIKKIAENELRLMILSDYTIDVKYLYENSPEYRSARELLRLKLQEIVNS